MAYTQSGAHCFEPYAISLQNEPYFHEPYNSCVYYDSDLNNLVTKTRATLTAAALSTRIFGAEHMFHNGTGYYGVMLDNPGLYAWAVHGYTDGVNPDYGTAAAWSTMWNTVSGKGKKLWMTETTGGSNALTTAKTLHAAFYSGKVSLWTWWSYADNLGTYAQTDGVNTSWNPSGTYWGTRHYARFVRPGAQMIGCSSDQGTLWASAYKNTDNTYAIVVINTATSATTLSIAGAGLPANWQRYESAGTNNCAHLGQVGSSAISIPASAVVSLVQGQNAIACRLLNGAWGGGMLASMLLPANDTMRSGSSWKFTYKEPPAGWQAIQFDHSTWRQAVDVGPVDIWPGFERWGMSAVNLYYQKARWLYCDTKMYFRKTVTIPSAQMLQAFGNNYRMKVYVDGVQLGQEVVRQCKGSCLETQANGVGQVPAGTHTIGLEVNEALVDGNGVLLKLYSMTGPTSVGIKLDSTWKCWPELVAGWNAASFDDAQWFNPGHDVDTWMGSSPNNALVPYVYPREFWYRGVFNSAEATDVVVSVARNRPGVVMGKIEYFNLRGQQIGAQTARGMSNSMVIRRVVTPAGANRVVTKVVVE